MVTASTNPDNIIIGDFIYISPFQYIPVKELRELLERTNDALIG